jgi:hypothetical protein
MSIPKWQETTSQNYSIHNLSALSSSLGEIVISELLNRLLLTSRKELLLKLRSYQPLSPLFEIDQSSVRPSLEPESKTFSTELTELSEETIIKELVKDDFIIQMPPVRDYTLRVRVKSIEKATPHIVNPDEI